MRELKHTLIIFLFFVAGLANADNTAQNPNLTVNIETDKNSYSIGDEIKLIHDGYYFDCVMSCQSYDRVLLPESAIGQIKISATYKINDANPKNFTVQDCKEANISLDLFSEQDTSNKIHPNLVCEGEVCGDPSDPMSFLDKEELAIFCQHHSALTKSAWVGTLESNEIIVNLNNLNSSEKRTENF